MEGALGINRIAGTVSVTRSTFSGNMVTGFGSGGAVVITSIQNDFFTGAEGSVSVTKCDFSENTATNGGGAIFFSNSQVPFSLTRSDFSDNDAERFGGTLLC